ncbi:DNA adenine methylase [Paenibacillus sp. USDA918EY]|uniref:DNA adenine methylase n=1 Tax=Paenibacillus sp. USDA918EY TaxID=2689575 RepID=UPI0013573825|nr:DNA adenine methylase [Paenibacillus sp. USDA918EY]
MKGELLADHVKSDIWDLDLNYAGENNVTSFFSSNANIHSYPAKAVPEMINSLLINLKTHYNVRTVLDPFLGTGTVGLESKVLGLDFYGSDLNPLAVLLSKVKMLAIKNTDYIGHQITEFMKKLNMSNSEGRAPYVIEKFENIDFWFKKNNIIELSFVKSEINWFLKKRTKKYKETFALILLTAFSSTIRSVSLTRNGEFKLYKMSPSEIERFNVNAINVFKNKIKNLLELLEITNKQYNKQTISEIHLSNAKSLFYLENKKIDLVLTSPPYGDSKSTVAYGQFSKLSLQWMKDLMQVHLGINVYAENCDEHLLGGKNSDFNLNEEVILTSKTLNDLIVEMQTLTKNKEDSLKKILNELSDIMINTRLNLQTIQVVENNELLKLITERIRLDIYRKIKNTKSHLPDKRAKMIARKESARVLEDLKCSNKKVKYRRLNQIVDKLPFVKETIKRKIKSQPKRINEVINFFKDLYKVVVETDRHLEKNGLQAWIVGHRTVLGEINVNMVNVLKEWFEHMNYKQVTSLQRQYSFKRMPHHINSTATRNDEIKTMMQEHILVVQKNNH